MSTSKTDNRDQRASRYFSCNPLFFCNNDAIFRIMTKGLLTNIFIIDLVFNHVFYFISEQGFGAENGMFTNIIASSY